MTNLTVMLAGQSNVSRFCGEPVAGVNPVSGTYFFQNFWRPITSSDGAGMIRLANSLRASGYSNVSIYECGPGGTALIPQAMTNPAVSWGETGGGPVTDCLAQVAAGVTIPQFVVWIQGESDVVWAATNPSFDMVGQYKKYLDQLRLYLLGRWGVTYLQCPWLVTPVGNVYAYNTQSVLQSQQTYSAPGVALGPPRGDLGTVDGVHLTGPACVTFADRLTPAILAFIQELAVMTDPQDKAAIVELQDAVTGIQTGIAGIASQQSSLAALVAASSAASAAAVADLTLQVAILGNQVNPPAPGTFGAGTFGTGTFG